MGNTMCCAPSPGTVRIHQQKGKVLEFYAPILASKLMLEYPNHLIVYRCINGKPGSIKQSASSPNSKSVGQNAEVRVVRASTRLELGHAYFLVHIPEQYHARFSKYFKITNSQVAPEPAAATPPQVSKLECSATAAAAAVLDLAAGAEVMGKGSKNSSSNPRLQKRKVTRTSKSASKSSRNRRSPRGSAGTRKTSSGRSSSGSEESGANVSSTQKTSAPHESLQKSSGLSTRSQYLLSKYGRQQWKPLLKTISESDES